MALQVRMTVELIEDGETLQKNGFTFAAPHDYYDLIDKADILGDDLFRTLQEYLRLR